MYLNFIFDVGAMLTWSSSVWSLAMVVVSKRLEVMTGQLMEAITTHMPWQGLDGFRSYLHFRWSLCTLLQG